MRFLVILTRLIRYLTIIRHVDTRFASWSLNGPFSVFQCFSVWYWRRSGGAGVTIPHPADFFLLKLATQPDLQTSTSRIELTRCRMAEYKTPLPVVVRSGSDSNRDPSRFSGIHFRNCRKVTDGARTLHETTRCKRSSIENRVQMEKKFERTAKKWKIQIDEEKYGKTMNILRKWKSLIHSPPSASRSKAAR